MLRPEEQADADFLFTLFCSHTLAGLTALPVDDIARRALVRIQFTSQTMSYRAQFPQARFDIVEHEQVPIGRLIVDEDPAAACIVDFSLLPAWRACGLGTAILTRVLARVSARSQVVRCKVMWNNAPSLRMCRRLGFVQTGEDLPFLQLEWQPPSTAMKPADPTA